MASLSRFLTIKLKLKVNEAKSAVDRPWRRKFLGYSMTWHRKPRLKVASASLARLKDKVRERLRGGQGRNLKRQIEELTPLLRGWINYFRLAEVKGVLPEVSVHSVATMETFLYACQKPDETRSQGRAGLADLPPTAGGRGGTQGLLI
jgi:RNA-directed DNA polymerase